MLNLNLIHNQVFLGFNSDTVQYKHTIVELSMRQWNRFKSNSILVENYAIDMSDNRVPLVSYDKITYDVNIDMKRKNSNPLEKLFTTSSPILVILRVDIFV